MDVNRSASQAAEGLGSEVQQDSYDYLFKFMVIGSAGTGKSCLLHQFIEGRFKDDSSHTIGVEFGSKVAPVGGKSVKLQVPENLPYLTRRVRFFKHQLMLGSKVSKLMIHSYFDRLAADMGHGRSGEVPLCYQELLSRRCR